MTRLRFRREFTRIFDDRWDSIFRYLQRLTGDPQLAADVAQEAFVRLFQRGGPPENPAQWLIAVAHNLLRDHERRSSRRRRILASNPNQVPTPEPAASPDVEASQRELRMTMRAALDRLKPRERQLVLLRAEGHSYREIGEIVGMPGASVGTSLARALAALRAACREVGLAPE